MSEHTVVRPNTLAWAASHLAAGERILRADVLLDAYLTTVLNAS